MADILTTDTIPGGAHWSLTVPRGVSMRLTDLTGGANVGMLFHNPHNPLERYNAPDTLKCQHTFRLAAGNCLYSDMGRIFCRITSDSLGWHDTVCGNVSRQVVATRWGETTYQQARNDRTQNGHDSFLIELAKHGLGPRDLAANVNWFSRVTADPSGRLTFDPTHSPPGSHITLRFEMETLVLLHTCPHPLNLSQPYPRRPVQIDLLQNDSFDPNLPGFLRAENRRGLENNRRYHLGRDNQP